MTPRPGARAAYGFNAALAGGGFLLVLALSGLGLFDVVPMEGHLYGGHPAGLAGALPRMFDTLSYFTEWSNIVVAVSTALLWLAPGRDTYWRRVLRADSLLMITVTAIVYAVLLAPVEVVTGWSVFTNPLQHIVVPVVTVLVFLFWGPRGWFSLKVVLGSLILPTAWIVWMLVRGLISKKYPYGFIDPITYGYPAVMKTLVSILVFGVVVALVFWAVDVVLCRLQGARPATD